MFWTDKLFMNAHILNKTLLQVLYPNISCTSRLNSSRYSLPHRNLRLLNECVFKMQQDRRASLSGYDLFHGKVEQMFSCAPFMKTIIHKSFGTCCTARSSYWCRNSNSYICFSLTKNGSTFYPPSIGRNMDSS